MMMHDDELPELSISVPVRELLRDIDTRMAERFAGTHRRLDTMNGRVRANELALADKRGRAVMAGAIAGVVGSAVVAIVVALILRGLGQ